jgi:hypothetical protein
MPAHLELHRQLQMVEIAMQGFHYRNVDQPGASATLFLKPSPDQSKPHAAPE